MNDLIEADHCNSMPTTAEQLVSSVCELSSESDLARKWDGFQDEWHPNYDGIVPIRQIMALDRRGEANTLAQVLEWRPFRSKEHLIATLLIGYAHQIVSRSFYEHLRVMYPTSILNRSLFGLSLKSILAQEIANPVVSPMIEYYPQDAGGCNVYKLSQSKKWLHHLSKADRAQMCQHEDYDYYLFEPAQLVTNDIVVPFYFYQRGDERLAKCAIPQFVTHEGSDLEMIVPENPAFDDAQLVTIPVTQFYRDYPRIQDGNGQMLAARCNNSLTGM
ncbi:hypothetical protein PCANC_20164 [Puccinia coronata f. sp. avenae]|uniref:Uncharacterized protein n=1 Tax=Puccinia coronata f. sp. avenae TaxID=200324 RepID=A0A2N5SGN6_9BASI|nr:hypothetical protein PCANC_20164 [Puccinia coronata f. sp. avenae]